MDGRGADDREAPFATPLRVLEISTRLAPAFAGLLLGSTGADVVQVRPPGRRLSVAESAYYDRGRRLLGSEEAASVVGLADVVITDLDDEALADLALSLPDESSTHPQAQVRIGALGTSGPHAGFQMTDLTEWASGGLAYVTRRPHPGDDARYTPVPAPGSQGQLLAGLAAASAALAAWRFAQTMGPALVHAEVSVQEVLAATLHYMVPAFVNNADVIGHPSTPNPGLGMLLPAADGDVYIRTVEQHQWAGLMAWMGDPEWADALGGTAQLRVANAVALRTLIGEWTATQPREELVTEGQRRRIPIVLTRSLTDVLAWEHLRARDGWRTIDCDGAPVEGPAIPALEPREWRPTAAVSAKEVVTTWEAWR